MNQNTPQQPSWGQQPHQAPQWNAPQPPRPSTGQAKKILTHGIAAAVALLAGVGIGSSGSSSTTATADPQPTVTVHDTTTVTATPTAEKADTRPTPTVTVTKKVTVTKTVTKKPADSGSGTSGGGSVYYQNCTAARAAGAAPLYAGDPGYSSNLDRDGDGVACE